MSRLRVVCNCKFWLLLLTVTAMVSAQTPTTPTTISVTTSVVQSPVKRLGINLGAVEYYDSGQMLKNLVVSNPSFEGQIAQSIIQCGSGTVSSCTDSASSTGWPNDFWDGATYTFVYGTAIGRSGTISTFTDTNNALPAVFNFSDSTGAVPGMGDYMIVKKVMPGGAAEGWSTQGTTANATVTTNTTDLPPGTLGKQTIALTAPNAYDVANILYYFDSVAGHTFLQLNGSYTLSFKAKPIGGANSLYVGLKRLSSPSVTYVGQTVPLTSGWQTYTIPFTASENGLIGTAELFFSTTDPNSQIGYPASSFELDDVSLVQNNGDGTNPSVFRDPVVAALRQLNPGVMRFWVNQLGETLDNMLAPDTGRQRSQYTAFPTTADPNTQFVDYSLPEFLQLCQTVGNGSSGPLEPWIVTPITLSPTEASNLIDYLAGPTSTVYGALRAAQGQTAPWTTVFPKIHLEFGNEAWNQLFYGGSMTNGQAYGTRSQVIFAAMKNNPNYNAGAFDLMVNGNAFNPGGGENIQFYSPNNDTFAAQPYIMLNVNDPAASGLTGQAALENLFGSTFAEPEEYVNMGGTGEGIANGEVLQNQIAAQSSGRPVPLAVTETNISPYGGSITQAELNAYVSSMGAGLAVVDTMLQDMRVGVLTQNLFQLPQYTYYRGDGSSMYLFGSVVDMGVTNLKRPQFLTEQMANNAIGVNSTMLQTVQSGLNPTWNQALVNSVQYNSAHYLQSFAFAGQGTYSLIVLNLNRSATEAVNFGGSNVPGGTVQMTQLTSTNLTDTNETASVVAPVSSSLSNFNPSATMTLPPFSMTVLTWTAPAISNVAVSAITGTSATFTWTTDVPATSQVNYGTTSSYGSQSTLTSTLATSHSVTLTSLTAGTVYNFSVASANSAGVSASSTNGTFGTPASFTFSAPSTITTTQGSTANVSITITTSNGYTGTPSLLVSGLPTGARASFQTVSGGATMSLTVGTTVPAATYPLTLTATSGSTVISTPISLVVTQVKATTVNLQSGFNIYAIFANGSAVTNGGLDTGDYAYSANLLGSNLTVGIPYSFGAVGSANGASSTTLALPVGSFTTLNFLGAAVYGGQLNQTFVVTYTDGTTSTFTQSISDWGSPQSYPGENLALNMAYRLTPTGATSAGNWNLYQYSFALNAAKTVKSLGLPNNRDVVLLAVTLTGGGSSPSLTAQTITFGTIATQTVGSPLTLAATASSGLTVSYGSTTTSVCTVSGATVTFLAPGTCSITASQTGNATYAAATPVTQSFSVLSSQTITFGTIATQKASTPLTLVATASSGLTVSFASTTGSVCTISGATASFLAAGTCTITASQMGDSTYAAATPVTQSFSVLSSQTITFGTIATQKVSTPLTLVATASSGLTVSFASTTGSVCTVSGATVTFLAPGTCSITASQTGNATYAAATPVTQSFSVQSTATTVSTIVSLTPAFNIYGIFNNGSTVTNGGLDTSSYAYSATLLGTGLTFQNTPYSFGAPNAANAVSSTVVSLPGGNYATLNFLGTAIYGNQAAQSFTVTYTDGTTTAFTQSISDWGSPQNYSGESIASTMSYRLTPTGAQQAGPWYVYAYSFPLNTAKIIKSLTLPNSRNVTVLAVTLSGGTGPTSLANQTITFGTIATQKVGTPLILAATASSGLTVSYASTTNSICTVSGATATFLAPGTCSITASQAGNVTYAAATPVTQSFSVLSAQTITFGTIATQKVGTPLNLAATTSSGLTVSYASTTNSICTVSGATANFLAPGTCSITASQAGNATYAAATPVTQSFSVLSAQTITFGAIATQKVGTPLNLAATASSGLTVSYASTTNSICTVSGATATFLASGICSITASQAGNATYAAATPVTQSFSVQTLVSLTPAFNIYGIFNNGSTVTKGGLDTASYAYSVNLLGTGLMFNGIAYSFGTPGSADAVSSATIALPSGNYATLNFLGSAVFGNQGAQPFTVTYTDGTTTAFTQSISDWGSPQSYSGESIASTMSYRLTPTGAQQAGPWYVYAYSLPLNTAKTVKSLTLPNSRNVTVLAVTLTR